MSDPLIHDCDNFVILEPGKSEVILTSKETKEWLKKWLSKLEELPEDLKVHKSIDSAAQHLIDTACDLEIYPGFSLQWFAVRLEPSKN